MPSGILSRRCDCGQILFFVKDQETARWLRGQNERLLEEFGASPWNQNREIECTSDIFVFGFGAIHCSRCEAKLVAPLMDSLPPYQLEFVFKQSIQSPNPLDRPLPVHPAPPSIAPVACSKIPLIDSSRLGK